jgi:ferredoxin, 2Fe-2S
MGVQHQVCTLMVHVTFIETGNTRRTVDVPEGLSVMEGALRHHIPGIEGDCGGACACATCHVYVEPDWLDRLEPPSQLETNMLKMATEPNAQSRLSCQIKLSPKLEGLTVRTPKSQY